MIGNGYTEEGFDEWVETQKGKYPPWVEIIVMENDLGVPNVEIDAIKEERERAWAYYHELKTLFDGRQRKTA